MWRDEKLRVILVDDENYPGYCRVIWNSHIKEMSDLAGAERDHLWGVLNVVESLLRHVLDPLKINLASLGNQVPHLHWHVIPRWADDPHYPNPIWGARPAIEASGSEAMVVKTCRAERRLRAAQLPNALKLSLESKFPW